MKPFLVLNPGASSTDSDAIAEVVAALPGVVVATTEGPGDGTRLAAEAARHGFDTVIAAGGDGTITEVVDGLATLDAPPRLALIPLGTGNDLARTLAIPVDPREAVATLLAERERRIDLVAVSSADGARTHAINVSAGGFSGEVSEAITPESKRLLGPLAYVWSAVKVLGEIEPYRARITWDGGAVEELEALNIVVANCRTIGGGRAVAPLANPEDGLLDVVIVRFGTTLDLAKVAARIVAGDYLDDELVSFRRAASLSIESEPPMPWNADGELLTRAAITFKVRPRALPVLVGAEYRADVSTAERDSG
jgi:diacylglycerol kinase (ATP)